jgi:hypothetical protein
MSRVSDSPGYPAQWCVHYRSPSEADTCEAGVSYERFRQSAPLPWPCFMDKDGKPKPDTAICWDQRPATTEEIEAHKQWARESTRKLLTALEVISPWRKQNKGKGVSEIVPCPICAGHLHLTISKGNGHVWGRCETEGCVSWVE